MICYTFFFVEGSIVMKVLDEEEDLRIADQISSGGILEISTNKFDWYVNMSLVKCTVREVLEDNAVIDETNAKEILSSCETVRIPNTKLKRRV